MIKEYLVSWNVGPQSALFNQIYKDREEANKHIRKLLSAKKDMGGISNIKLESRKVGKWKKVING